MKNFTGWQWLLIDAANQYGHDKMTFEDRIKWAEDNLSMLEAIALDGEAKTRPLYLKAVQAIRKAQNHQPSGHLVGVDACSSGIQIMSALTGCLAGATATGLIDPNVRADAYAKLTEVMNRLLNTISSVSRPDAKQALMTAFYGSKQTPKDIFGEDTPELSAFYQAAQEIAPGAWELLHDLLDSWNPYALSHAWKLPDGYDTFVKVMQTEETRIEVDELDHSTFTYEFSVNKGSKKGLSNAANVVHSVDAYVMRTMHRRCNYDVAMATRAADLIEIELLDRAMDSSGAKDYACLSEKEAYYLDQYQRSSLVDITIAPHLTQLGIMGMTTPYLLKLQSILAAMLSHRPFELVTVHDEFKAHANNINHVRYHYKEILADISESTLLDDLLSQVYGTKGTFRKLQNIGSLIRNSNYALS